MRHNYSLEILLVIEITIQEQKACHLAWLSTGYSW